MFDKTAFGILPEHDRIRQLFTRFSSDLEPLLLEDGRASYVQKLLQDACDTALKITYINPVQQVRDVDDNLHELKPDMPGTLVEQLPTGMWIIDFHLGGHPQNTGRCTLHPNRIRALLNPITNIEKLEESSK